MAKRQHIILHKRRRHAGTLAFFTLVPVADLAGAVLTVLYGASVGAWLLTVAKWLLVSTGDFLQHDVLTILVLIFILFFLGIAVGVKEAESKAIAVGLTLFIAAIWGILRLGFKLQWDTPLLSALPNLHQFAFNFPGLVPFLAQPNRATGVVWLGIYALIHLVEKEDQEHTPVVTPRPGLDTSRRSATAIGRLADVAAGVPAAAVEGTLARNEPEAQQAVPTSMIALNEIDLNEDKWRILTTCIQFYQEALTRLYPNPFPRVKAPPRKRMRYISQQDDHQVTWHGRTLVFAESLFDPINENRLLTLLARRLWECNSPDRWLRLVMCAYPKLGCLAIPLTLFGEFMILPIMVRWLLNWRDWRADRVLAADRFAWSCGQGERLLHQIAQWIDAGLEEPDPYLPRYAERRGHLEGLVKSEQTQMVNQGLTPAYPLRGMQAAPFAPTLPTGQAKQQRA
jgi:hypothetical protein